MADRYSTPAVPKQPTVLPCPSIDDLHKESNSDEHLFAILAHPLLAGKDVDGAWLQIRKLNNPQRKDDDAIYEVDYGLCMDEMIVGYIDVECKPGWTAGGWPYPVTNIAKHPMAHWRNGQFTGRLTNKLLRFREKPHLSFWIAMRNDWRACWIVNATTIFEDGEDAKQPTRYSTVPLKVIQISNDLATFCEDAARFTDHIISAYRSGICHISIPF